MFELDGQDQGREPTEDTLHVSGSCAVDVIEQDALYARNSLLVIDRSKKDRSLHG